MSKSLNRETPKRRHLYNVKSYKTSKSASFKKRVPGSEKKVAACCNSLNYLKCENTNDAPHTIPIVNILEKLNFKYEIMPSDESDPTSLYMQDKYMNKFFSYYPQHICLDILCEVPELDCCVVLFIGLDTNGHCEIVALGFIKSGSFQALSWLCDVFKKHNPSWKQIEFLISDQNSVNRDIILKAFPEKLLFISFFHSMKAFRRELSTLEPFATHQDINKALHIFEQMMYVTSESSYVELQKQLKHLSPHIFSLFKKNWHLRKDFWALGLYSDSKIFLKAFNSYLLNIRKKIKPYLSTQKSIEDVVQKLHLAIRKLQKEFFQKITCTFQTPVSYPKVNAMQNYSKYLTPFATELVNEQLNYAEKLKNVQKLDHSTYKVNEIMASFNTCSCHFNAFMMLPCSHIFAVRDFLSLPLFIDNLRSSWTVANYQKTFFNLYSAYIADKNEVTDVNKARERFEKYFKISQELWYLMLHCPENVSQERIEVFQNLLKAWKSSFKIGISVCEKQNHPSTSNVEALRNVSTDYFKEIYGISLSDILDSENEFPPFSSCSEGEDLF